jgi:hypothetical protein
MGASARVQSAVTAAKKNTDSSRTESSRFKDAASVPEFLPLFLRPYGRVKPSPRP